MNRSTGTMRWAGTMVTGWVIALSSLAAWGAEPPCPEPPQDSAAANRSANADSFLPGSGGGVRRLVVEELAEKLAAIPTLEIQQFTTIIEFTPQSAKFVRLVIQDTSGSSQPCVDELEVYGSDGTTNLALAQRGAVASASSLLPGYAIHQIEHVNDGQLGNDHSWIAADRGTQWVQVALPEVSEVSHIVFSRDRQGLFRDRLPIVVEIHLSMDEREWHVAARWNRSESDGVTSSRNPLCQYQLVPYLPVARLAQLNWTGVVEYAFGRERETWSQLPADDHLSPLVTDRPAHPGGEPYWGRIARLEPLERVLVLYEELIERLAIKGLDVTAERAELAQLQRQASALPNDQPAADPLYMAARWAKRKLFLRDPDLAPLERILFAKRHPLLESHNYSEHLDGYWAPGGGVFVLSIPRDAEGRLKPSRGEIERLFDGSEGIVRDPVLDYEAKTVYFAYRPDTPQVAGWQPYWHLYAMDIDGSSLRMLTDGPYHDFDPVVLPDGGLAFHTTRCEERFLCWRPQAYVLFRMDRDGSNMTRLSHANLSEWKPSVMRDGRILWTRSEYLDKGADFGHTLWAMRPDGTAPELIFGNNTPNCYSQAHEVPGTREIVCTLMSHGDHQGPIALIDRDRGTSDTAAITNITPDTRPHYQMSRSHFDSFRDPYPVSRDHFLVTHNPDQHHNWGIYVIDRYGNRELLYLDPEISSKRPTPLRPRQRPPVLPNTLDRQLAEQDLGQFIVEDVYVGLGANVPRGMARYLQISEEVTSSLEKLPCGQLRDDHPPFQDFYASPIHLLTGPPRSYLTTTPNAPLTGLRTGLDWPGLVAPAAEGLYSVTEPHGWPSYVAKTTHGTVRIEEDGSTSFLAPARKVLYFQLLDEDFNEIQRMRSVVQLQPGERRSCIGCHESRQTAPPPGSIQALQHPPQQLEPPPWGAVPFSYETVVQPVWDRHCVRCHDGSGTPSPFDLRGVRDEAHIPASYRSLIAGGWVHYFDYGYGMRHFKAEPLSFGTLQSRLWATLADQQHRDIVLDTDEMRAVKAWVDLNCPLWPDYTYRPERADPAPAELTATSQHR